MRYAVVLAVIAACGDNRAPPDPVVPTETVVLPAVANRKLDLLVVLGNEVSTLDHQNQFSLAFPALERELEIGGKPDLHLGVITPDLGARAEDGVAADLGNCRGSGSDGALLTLGATSVDGNYVIDSELDSNHAGTLAEAFNAISHVGSTGCGFQQPIAAIRAALANPANAGFVRPDAALGVIVLADEDDCSLKAKAMFDLGDASIGPPSTYRCAIHGIQCDPDDPVSIGPRANCVPRMSSDYVVDPQTIHDMLVAQKSDREQVAVAVTIGDAAPVTIEPRSPPGGGTPIPAIAHVCAWVDVANSTEVADPGVRLDAFARGFGNRGTVTSICQEDLSGPADRLGVGMRRAMGDPCIEDALPAGATCTAADRIGDGPELVVPHCDVATTTDCWELVTDEAVCPNAEHRELVVHRSHPAPVGTYTFLRCTML